MSKTRNQRAARDSITREQVLEHLTDVVHSLLKPVGDTSRLYVRPPSQQFTPDPSRIPAKVFGTSDLTNNLCSSLEAVLIHGIKDTHSSWVSSMFSSEPNRMPVPNFWPVVMSVCHKDDIKEVCCLAFITSDIGRGRAWLRLIINGGQVNSYMDALTRETAVLKDYYRPGALLRSVESCSQLVGVLQPVCTLLFQLATNAAVLNTWTQTPLVLAGLWFPTDGHTVQGWSQPVKEGIDALNIVTEPDEPSQGFRSSVFMEETPLNDHLFYAILAATPSTNFIEAGDGAAAGPDAEQMTPQTKPLVVRTLHPLMDEYGNRIDPPPNTDIDTPDESGIRTQDDDQHNDEELLSASVIIPSDGESLTGSYGLERTVSDDGSTVTSASSMDYNTLISKRLDNVDYRYLASDGLFNNKTTLQEDHETSSEDESDDSGSSQQFEHVPQDENAIRVTRLSSLVSRLCNQTGLDEQKYQCFKCHAFIGVFYGEFRVCAMDGKSYCVGCHNNGTAIVPARVLYNWDLRQHLVSDSNKAWLEENIDTPMLDIRAANPKLYAHVDELSQLKTLRTQLLYLRAYLFTCRSEGIADKLRQIIAPREHLHEHVHLYSVADLLLVSRGGLLSEVQEAVCFARLHIRDCQHCTARGFLCELCSTGEVIFPFQLDVAQTCPECCAVFHRVCTRRITECPRCVRRRNRRLLQLKQQEQDDHRDVDDNNSQTINVAISTDSSSLHQA